MTRLAIFDLDGTLLNTIGDLAVSCNAVLALRGLPQHSYEDYCRFVGNGIKRLVERALPEALRTPYTVDAVRRDFVAYYLAHIDEHTLPYEGIPEVVGTLAKDGYKLAIVSNKGMAAVKELAEHFFKNTIKVAIGESSDVRRKPAPDAALLGMRLLGVSKEESLYVGDSEVDIATAKNAGIDCLSVSWGFRTREHLEKNGAVDIIDKPSEIVDFLK